MACIYRICNKESGKSYVGQTKHPAKIRWAQHRYASKNPVGSYGTISEELGRLGLEAFSFEVLEEDLQEEELDDREVFWINELDTMTPLGYNARHGGHRHMSYSEESRMKMRNSANAFYAAHPEYRLEQSRRTKEWCSRPENKEEMSSRRLRFHEENPGWAKIHSDDMKKIIASRPDMQYSLRSFYNNLSEEERVKLRSEIGRKVGDKLRGRKMTPEQCQRNSDAQRGVLHSEERIIANSRAHAYGKIICCSNGKEYLSLHEAAKDTGINKGTISEICRKVTKARDDELSWYYKTTH